MRSGYISGGVILFVRGSDTSAALEAPTTLGQGSAGVFMARGSAVPRASNPSSDAHYGCTNTPGVHFLSSARRRWSIDIDVSDKTLRKWDTRSFEWPSARGNPGSFPARRLQYNAISLALSSPRTIPSWHQKLEVSFQRTLIIAARRLPPAPNSPHSSSREVGTCKDFSEETSSQKSVRAKKSIYTERNKNSHVYVTFYCGG